MTEEQLKNLLRQRANPEAPDGYFDSLLNSLHRKQREELLHRSLWQIAVDRIGTFWGEHSFSGTTYGFAVASITLVGMLSILSLKSTPSADATAIATRSIPTSKLDILPAAAFQESEPVHEQKKRPSTPDQAQGQ